MTDPRNVQGSNKDVAAGGLDPEAAFASLDQGTANRLEREAKAVAESVSEQNRKSPGGHADVAGRDNHAGS